MKRADRLYALMQRLKDGRLHKAEDMARDLGVSLRTIYRDMDTLAASGVPVEGARGQGYTAQRATTLPPLNLSADEVEVLHLALAVVGQSPDAAIQAAAAALSAKIDAVLPEDAAATPGRFGFATYPFAGAAEGFRHMPAFRAAIRARQKLRVTLAQEEHARDIRPLHMDYWGRIWTCVVWDESTGDFATFRIDNIAALAVLPGLFVEEPGKRYSDFQARQRQ